MTTRAMVSLAIIVALAPAAARAQGVEIEHKAVGCIVVGKYPKMNACFTPVANVARSRVYFRPEGVPSWYYVDMKTDQPCFTGVLPKPGKKLVGKKIEYYVEAQDKTFNPARTAEYDPIVVKSAQECKKNVPVAPFLNNATVAVFPAVPAGFVGGGIGTAAVVGIVGAGAAAAGTAAVVVSNNNNDTTTTTVAVGVNSTTTTTTLAPTSTTTTTLPTTTNHAPFAVLTTNPDPPSGTGPLTVTFDLCKSTDPDKDPLSFFFDFGDGGKATGSCLETHTYQASFRAADSAHALDKSYTADCCVVDPGGLSACRSRNVNVTSPPPPTTLCGTPVITITQPKMGGCANIDVPLPVSADASSSVRVNFNLEFLGFGCSYLPQPVDNKDVFGTSPYSTTMDITSFDTSGCYKLSATAFNACAKPVSATPVTFNADFGGCCGCFTSTASDRKDPSAATAAWSSDLSLVGGRLQVVVNGTGVTYSPRGRTYGLASLVEGENRVEATVVESSGKRGLWRFDFTQSRSVAPGSIRVTAGDIVQIAPTSVTFRLRGETGERLAFTFEKK